MKKLNTVITIALFSLTGCAGGIPVGLSNSVPVIVPGGMIQLVQESEPNSVVVVLSDAGRNYRKEFWADGIKVSEIDVGERLSVRVKPGDHIFGVRATTILRDFTLKTVYLDVQAGRSVYLRIGTDTNNNNFIQQTSLEIAEKGGN